jgi:hypothetical protein
LPPPIFLGNQSSSSLDSTASNTTSFLSIEALAELGPIADTLERVVGQLRNRLAPQAGSCLQQAIPQPLSPASSLDPPVSKYRFMLHFPIFAKLFHHMESLTISFAYEDGIQFNWDESHLFGSVNDPDMLWPFAHEAYESVIAANNNGSIAPESGE